MENRFKQRRIELGLTAEQAAVKAGVTLGSLYSWERGDNEPQADKLRRLAQAYDVSVDWLLGLSK